MRVDGSGRIQQLACTGDVGHIGVVLAGVDRVVGQTIHLGALDFAVPVSALDQSHHQAASAATGQIDQIVDHIRAAFLIGLDHKAQTVPAGETGGVGQRLQQVQRQLQPVGLFGVDIEAYAVAACQLAQLQNTRQQLLHDALALRAAVAWVQSTELDGNAWGFINAFAASDLAYGMNRIHVRLQIALSICGGEGGLAQHVVGVAKAFGFERAGTLKRQGHVLAHHELLTHQAHGHVHALAHQWLAAPCCDAFERGPQARLSRRMNQLAGHHQPPGCGIDKQRRAFAQVDLPVAIAQLVSDQCVACGGIWSAQQGLGQAHQSHSFA